MKNIKQYFILADRTLVAFSLANFGYVTYLSGFFSRRINLSHILVFIVSLFTLIIGTLRFSSWYRNRYIPSTAPRKRDELDGTFILWILSIACLLYPFYFSFENFSLFQLVFPIVTSTMIAWASYLDGRLLFNAAPVGTSNQGPLDTELKFFQVLVQPIAWFYAFTIVTAVLSIGKIDLIMGQDTSANKILFGIGVLLLMVQLHYLITARIFIRCEEILKELRARF